MSDNEFDGQRDGEEVELIFRRHILTASKGIFFLIFVSGLGLVPLFIWKDQPILFWVFCVAVLIGIIGCIYIYMLWYFSFCVVTNQRIRKNTQHGLFRRSVVDLRLDKIQSISYEVPGFLGGLFGYGTLLFQAEAGDVEIHKVSKPAKVYDEIQNIIGKVG